MHSEVLALTWQQIDLEGGTIQLYRGATKNKDGRLIHLPQVLKQILDAQWKEHLASYPTCLFVFHKKGERIGKFYKTWDRACKDAGISGKVAHDFRRTAVRNLVRAGVPERVAMTITAHKTRDVFDRYNIVSAGDLEEAARKMDERITSRTTTSLTTTPFPTEGQPLLSH